MSNKLRKPVRARSPDAERARRERIEQSLAAGDVAGAAALAEAALKAGQSEPMILNLAAWQREEDGDFAGAHRLLKKALALAPGDVMVLGAIGAVLRKEGRLDDALAVLDQVLAAEPRHSAAWLERGYVMEDLKSEPGAVESFRRAIALDPNMAPALGKLADIAARKGEKDVARNFASRALAVDPREPSATFAMATLQNEARKSEQAELRLRRLLQTPLKDDDRTRSLTLLGDALDRQNRPAEAFAAWSEAQQLFRTAFADVFAATPERPAHRGFVEIIAQQVADAPDMPRPKPIAPVPGEASNHVFLLGYPRSGTTLVENILASAPDTLALEERETFAEVDPVLLPNSGRMPDLDALDDQLLGELRARYWRQVQLMAGDVAGKTFVDMNPFNGIKLPAIARLFPKSRILIMRRDPRDVVLSCFRVNFVPSPGTYALSDLEEAARHYDAMMRLIELCRERLPLAFHEIRYDRLVADFETEVRAFAGFVGLEWTEHFHAFDKTARNRGVRTASATQVRQGLYDGGGRWRRYEAQLAPVLPILQPWVERFGFDR
jgi:Tfp pilus assembly protein PilF